MWVRVMVVIGWTLASVVQAAFADEPEATPKQAASSKKAASPKKEATTKKATGPTPAVVKKSTSNGPSYTLRYKFSPGEIVRWRVEHRSHVRTTIQGTTKSAESATGSVKVWHVKEVNEKGHVTFEHLVEKVQMRQKHSGAQEVTWDSEAEAEPPPVFEATAKSLGVVLSVVTMDSMGQIVDRKHPGVEASSGDEARMTVTLPLDSIKVGESWTMPLEVAVSVKGNTTKVRMRQKYTLQEVTNDVAVIKAETQILTPNLSPEVEAQIIQRESSGQVRFDIESGRIVAQQYDCDKQVFEFSGPQSSLQCRTRFSEDLMTEAPATAQKPEETEKK